jgi:sugar/nucleoside kinase (ribokinase family)
MKRLLVVGDVAWDVFMRPSGELVWGSDVYGQVDIFPGGAAANVAVWAKRLGSDVRLLGKVGDDRLGTLMLEHLASEGIAGDIMTVKGGETTRIGVIVRQDGEHAFVTDHSDPLRLTSEDLPESLLDGAGALFITGYGIFMARSPAFAANLLDAARQRGVAVAFDPASFSLVARYGAQRLMGEMGRLDVLLASEEEGAALLGLKPGAGAADLEALLEYAEVVVVKRGSKGATVLERGARTDDPAVEVDAVDATGAGDAFDAAFLDAYLRGLPAKECLRRANALGAAVASRLGAQTRR